MIEGSSPVTQALLGTLLTWGLTALGAAGVFFVSSNSSASGQRSVLAISLGFAAGVMLAASYWSLLAPAVEMSKASDIWGSSVVMSLVPLCGGFLAGAFFVSFADFVIEKVSGSSGSPVIALAVASDKYSGVKSEYYPNPNHKADINGVENGSGDKYRDHEKDRKYSQWKRILLLIVAITVHNIPEGLAVGVGFGAIGKSAHATFESARTLAWGIGLQNFPEGLAVSLPLFASGFSHWKSFWYGQLSGMIEPISGVAGALAVYLFEPLLPWSLSFAAGAMIMVIFSEIIPEARMGGKETLANWSAMIGFIIMMALDVGLS